MGRAAFNAENSPEEVPRVKVREVTKSILGSRPQTLLCTSEFPNMV
jgi:hypothetical protein